MCVSLFYGEVPVRKVYVPLPTYIVMYHVDMLTGTVVLVTVVQSRRGVNRHSAPSNPSASVRPLVLARHFAFSHKLNSTCQSSAVFERQQFQDVVSIVRREVNQLTTELVRHVTRDSHDTF